MLTTMLGLLLAVERPAMQAILFQLVGPDLLPSAVAANSTINSMSRLVGPALAGALIVGFGVGICFVVNAASYLVVIGALTGLRRSELIARPLLGRTKGKLREGFAYVRNQPDVRRPLLVMAVVGTMALELPDDVPVHGPIRVRPRCRIDRHRNERQRDRLDPRRHLHRRREPRLTPYARHRARSDSQRRSSRSDSPPDTGRSSHSASRWGSRRHRSNPSTPWCCSRPPNRRCKDGSWRCNRWPGSAARRSEHS